MRRSLLLATALSVVSGIVACAAGEVVDAVDDDAGSGDPGDASFPDVHHEAASFDVGPTPESGSGFDATPGDAGRGDAGGDSAAACASPNDCQGAEVIQSVSGDTNADTRTAQGYTSKWLQVLVTEDDNSPVGKKLKVSATLTSPPNTNFDLFLYIDEGGDKTTRACGPTATESSTNTSGADTVSHSWGEGTVANGSDDSRIVSLEVRHVSGACDPNAKWTLTVTGN